MYEFAQKKKLSQNTIADLKRLNAAMIGQSNLSLDFFTHVDVMERDKYLLRALGYDENEPHKLTEVKQL